MNQARFEQIADIIHAEADVAKRNEPMDITPDGDTLDRIAMLMRKGVTRGIYPQWSIRKDINAQFCRESLAQIAEKVEDGYTSCIEPYGWRLDVYPGPGSAKVDDLDEA